MADPVDTVCVMAELTCEDPAEPTKLVRERDTGRLIVRAYNQGGYDCTDTYLDELIGWMAAHPELVPEFAQALRDAERRGIEAAAKVAEEQIDHCTDPGEGGSYWSAGCRSAAEAIRALLKEPADAE